MDRASDSDSEGQRFESARVYQIKAVLKPEKNKKGKYLSYFFQSVSLRFYSVHLRDSEIWTLTEFAIPLQTSLLLTNPLGCASVKARFEPK